MTLAQVFDALSYYYDQKEAIDHDLLENSEDKLPDLNLAVHCL